MLLYIKWNQCRFLQGSKKQIMEEIQALQMLKINIPDPDHRSENSELTPCSRNTKL